MGKVKGSKILNIFFNKKKSDVSIEGYQQGNVIAPQLLNDAKLNEERNKSYTDRLYSEYPAIKRFAEKNSVILHADADFTRSNTGVGSIEYFAPFMEGERNSVQYNTGFEYWNPNKEGASIVYHPGENDYQDIRGDYITHAMHNDKGYEEQYDKFTKAFMNSKYGEDIKRDWFERVSKEENDGKAQHKRNNIDGVIRNLMFEGTNADFEKKRYWPAAKEEYLSDPEVKKAYDEIMFYLTEEDKNGNQENVKGMQDGGKTDDVIFDGILPDVDVIDKPTPEGEIKINYRNMYPYTEYQNESLKKLHPERFAELHKMHKDDYDEKLAKYVAKNNKRLNFLPDELDKNPYLIDEFIEKDVPVNYFGGNDNDYIEYDINSHNVKFSRAGEYVGGKVILGGDFVMDGQTAMPKREWNRRTKFYTSQGQKPLDKDTQLFQGVINGKFKIGNYSEFTDKDTVAPARFVFDFDDVEHKGSRIISHGKNGFNNINIKKGQGKILLFDKDTENYKYVYGSREEIKDAMLRYKKDYPDSKYMFLDNGRFNYYKRNDKGLTKEDYKSYYGGSWKTDNKMGFNLVIE